MNPPSLPTPSLHKYIRRHSGIPFLGLVTEMNSRLHHPFQIDIPIFLLHFLLEYDKVRIVLILMKVIELLQSIEWACGSRYTQDIHLSDSWGDVISRYQPHRRGVVSTYHELLVYNEDLISFRNH